MKYAVIGAGGMGIQYGVLLQEFAHKDVDFIDTWKPNVEKIREQGGAYVSQDGEDRHLVPINVYYPEEYAGQRRTPPLSAGAKAPPGQLLHLQLSANPALAGRLPAQTLRPNALSPAASSWGF